MSTDHPPQAAGILSAPILTIIVLIIALVTWFESQLKNRTINKSFNQIPGSFKNNITDIKNFWQNYTIY